MSLMGKGRGQVSPFFLNSAIETYSSKPSTPISLRHLINFGNQGRNTSLEKEGDKLLRGGNFLRNELPTRLSHRLRDLQSLPYIVASHPRMIKVYDLYLQAFDKLRRTPPLTNLDDNDRFCQFMQSMLDTHRVIIPELAIGIAESSPDHLTPNALDTFMTRMLRSRISRRVITEQHIALTSQFRRRQQRKGKGAEIEEDERVGVVDTKLNAAEVVRKCTALIQRRGGIESQIPVVIEGELHECFAYIPEHLEFMLYETVKNALYATVGTHGPEATNFPITITLVHGPKELVVRISDQAGGIPAFGGIPLTSLASNSVLPSLTSERLDIFSFSHMRRLHLHQTSLSTPSTSIIGALKTMRTLEGTVWEQISRGLSQSEAEENDAMDAQTESGIGLPLAKMFAEYFGGGLEINTTLGHGSDASIRIAKLGLAAT